MRLENSQSSQDLNPGFIVEKEGLDGDDDDDLMCLVSHVPSFPGIPYILKKKRKINCKQISEFLSLLFNFLKFFVLLDTHTQSLLWNSRCKTICEISTEQKNEILWIPVNDQKFHLNF